MTKSWIAILCLFMLAGCVNPLSSLLITKGQKEKEVAAVRAEYEGKLAVNRSEQDAATKRVLAGKDAQMAGAANAFYGQGLVFESIHEPTRTDLLFNNLAKEGHAALGNIPPTPEAMKAMNERLRVELDETKTTLAQLRSSHEQALVQNTALAEQTRKHQAELVTLENARNKLEADYRIKLDAKQDELITAQDKIIALEKARADDRAALQALKTKMSIVLGILALAGLAGAIYSPVLKQQCGLFGGVCALAAIGLWWVQPWHVAVIVGIVLLGLAGWLIAKHRKEERVADALSLSVHDLREKGGEIAAAVEASVSDRLARYVKKDGRLVIEKDRALESHVDSKLAEYDVLTVKPH